MGCRRADMVHLLDWGVDMLLCCISPLPTRYSGVKGMVFLGWTRGKHRHEVVQTLCLRQASTSVSLSGSVSWQLSSGAHCINQLVTTSSLRIV